MIIPTNSRNHDNASARVIAMTGDDLEFHGDSEVAMLESRLADGYQRIESAISRGENVQSWEDFWISLLHSYEELCDGMQQAA